MWEIQRGNVGGKDAEKSNTMHEERFSKRTKVAAFTVAGWAQVLPFSPTSLY